MAVKSESLMMGDTDIVVSANPCRTSRVVGTWDGAAEAWLQCFDAVSLPADTAVPVMAWQVGAGASFDHAFEHEFLYGCVFCFSSTGPTKTLSTGAGNVGNLTITGYAFDAAKLQTIKGDLATGADSLEVWTDANGPDRLVRLQVISSSASLAYAMLFTTTAVDGNVPLMVWPVPANTTLALDFGEGLMPERCPATTAKTMTDGCYIYMSSTATALTATSATEFVIRAVHL